MLPVSGWLSVSLSVSLSSSFSLYAERDTHTYVYIYIQIYVFTYRYTHMCVYVYIYVCVCLHMYICVRVCIHVPHYATAPGRLYGVCGSATCPKQGPKSEDCASARNEGYYLLNTTIDCQSHHVCRFPSESPTCKFGVALLIYSFFMSAFTNNNEESWL